MSADRPAVGGTAEGPRAGRPAGSKGRLGMADGKATALVVAAAVCWALYLAYRFGLGEAHARTRIGQLVFLPVAALACLGPARAGLRSRGRERAGWLGVSAGWGLSVAALALWALSADSTAAGWLYRGYYPCVFFAMVALADLEHARQNFARVALNALAIATAVHVFAWYFMLRHSGALGERWSDVVENYAGEMLLLLATALALHHRPGKPVALGVLAIAGSQLLATMADFAAVQAELHASRDPELLGDVLLASSALAAAVAGSLAPRQAGQLAPADARVSVLLLSEPVCIAFLGLGVIVADATWHGEAMSSIRPLSSAFAILATLAMLRLGVELREGEISARDQSRRDQQLLHAQQLIAIGQLAAGTVHDINNVMMALRGSAYALRSRSDQESVAADIDEAVDRVSALCRQMLAIARQRPVADGPLDLDMTVSRATKLLRFALPRHVSLSIELPSRPLLILGDAIQIEIVLLNLVVNARDALVGVADGRVELSVTRVDRPAGLAPAGPCAKLAVRDNGAGMDADTLAHCRDAFFTTKAEGAGTGLGLSTVNEVAQRLGGCLELESSPGRGTSAILFVPLVGNTA